MQSQRPATVTDDSYGDLLDRMRARGTCGRTGTDGVRILLYSVWKQDDIEPGPIMETGNIIGPYLGIAGVPWSGACVPSAGSTGPRWCWSSRCSRPIGMSLNTFCPCWTPCTRRSCSWPLRSDDCTRSFACVHTSSTYKIYDNIIARGAAGARYRCSRRSRYTWFSSLPRGSRFFIGKLSFKRGQ